VASTYYDPESAPDARQWLALSELERIRLAQNHHVSARVKASKMKTHAVIHVVVENQVASGYGPSKKAIARLVAEGLSRHEAVHAIGAVFAHFSYELINGQTPEQQASFQLRMGEAINQLHAHEWLSSGGGANDA
jgi:hypothetical protein